MWQTYDPLGSFVYKCTENFDISTIPRVSSNLFFSLYQRVDRFNLFFISQCWTGVERVHFFLLSLFLCYIIYFVLYRLKVWKLKGLELPKYTAHSRKSFLHYVNCLWECVETSSITKLVPLYSGMNCIVADNKIPDSLQWFLAIV